MKSILAPRWPLGPALVTVALLLGAMAPAAEPWPVQAPPVAAGGQSPQVAVPAIVYHHVPVDGPIVMDGSPSADLAEPRPAAFSAFPPQISGAPVPKTTGDCTVCGCHAGIPLPLGSFINRCVDIQAANARADLFVIYPHEWSCDHPVLRTAGLYHLDWICRHFGDLNCKVRVVPTGDPALDQMHLALVKATLARCGHPLAEELVVLAPPAAEGLRYDEIERVGSRILTGTSPTTGPSAPLAFPALLRIP